MRCLTLVVPEARGGEGQASELLVRLPVVIVRATAPHAYHNDPVVWVDYDAGDGFLAGRARIFTDQALGLNEHRDVITLDLRGTGGAEPSLACPEVTELNTGAFAADVDETSPEGRAMRLAAIGRCRDRLVAHGVDLSAYTSADAAQDIEDLRLALGIEQWNLVAGEYGSKLAQLLLRDHPDGVRSVVINATPVPLQADWFADLAPNAHRAWSALVAACDADAGCAAAFPDLAPRLEQLVADLTANPRRFDEVQLDGPVSAPYLFTASRLLAYVRYSGRDNNFVAQLPMSLAGPAGGAASVLQTLDPDDPATLKYPASDVYAQPSYGVWQTFPQDTSAEHGSHALGAHLSAVCSDEAPFTDAQRLTDAAAVPLFGDFLGHHGDLDACEVWAVPAAAPDADRAVHSDVPVLVLAAEFDMVSSPAWANALAETLTAAKVVHFAGTGTQPASGQGHTAQTCARQLRDQFIKAPNAPLDDTCAATARGPAFELP